jgi:hypothetical protein
VVDVLGRIHISIIFIHPLGVIEVDHMLLQVIHDLIDVLALSQDGHGVFLVEVVL